MLYSLFDAGFGYLHAVPASGGTPRRLTTDSVAYDILATWSPDGSHILFMPYDYPTSLEYVAVLPAVGGPVRTVTRDRTRALTGPVWTPDGIAVVYQGVDVRTRVVRVRVGELLARARERGASEAGQGG